MNKQDITQAFTDPVFRQFVADTYCDGRFSILREDVENVRQMELPVTKHVYNERVENISPVLDMYSLEGLEYFTGLEKFICKGYRVPLNLAQNTRLTYLDCSFSRELTELDITTLLQLNTLICNCCNLSAIDTTRNLRLEIFNCNQNPLVTPLDVTCNTQLKRLDCGSTNQSHLDISRNTRLEYLVCSGNSIATLDTSHQPCLRELYCSGNPFRTLDLRGNPLLTTLWISSELITEIDLSCVPRLKSFCSWMGGLTTLDFSYNPELEQIRVMGCENLSSINTRHNPKLKEYNVSMCSLTEVDISQNPLLEQFSCTGNKLTEKPDITHNPYLQQAGEGSPYVFRYSTLQPPCIIPEVGRFVYNERELSYKLQTSLGNFPWEIIIERTNEKEFKQLIPTICDIWTNLQ
ncbi:MAG: hypothetical protein LIP01_15450 [Tannerellaceae bacterium]|nr:hypothetical protein [Tannerellaceae bacterium]